MLFGKLKTPLKSEAASNGFVNNRLVIYDKSCNLSFLIDTGADISLLPKRILVKPLSTDLKLFAANGTCINIYGSKIFTLALGLRCSFKWNFIIADIQNQY